ncbi:MAG TPA: hypothetical protein VGR57_11440, partial [Ktedonobacterales bacterium]|nr:hypothetical protein [Ktedonobacterales bacterium]
RQRANGATMFDHLRTLTWTFDAGNGPIHTISIYSEPRDTPTGTVYVPRRAAESGDEGLACVDDVARAVVLALEAYSDSHDARHATLAREWLAFVRYMQLADGRFTNFVLDTRGTRNLAGDTSYPGGAWWTARALWSLAKAYRVLGDERALAALERCPLPENQTPPELKTEALLAIVGIDLLRSAAPDGVKRAWRARVTVWCDRLVVAGASLPYVPDVPGQTRVSLWGYHQLLALAAAGAELQNDAWLNAARRTVVNLARPVIAGGFYYAWPGEKANQCAYNITPLVQGLAELYRATGDPAYKRDARAMAAWFSGANDARTVMYDPATGRCLDGLTGTAVNHNCGAESAIEAGMAEIERRRLAE